MPLNPLGIRPLEMVAGFVWDERRRPPIELPVPAAPSPLAALEGAVTPALERGRCVVAFSGGRDSSLVLAAAVRAARRHGLDEPVPFTLEYPGHPASDEREWQERVLRWLDIQDWERRQIRGELDFTGPYARRALARHGLMWPELSYMFMPGLEVAVGGTLLTGIEGDSVLGKWRWQRARNVLAGRAPRSPRGLVRVAHALAPYPFKRAWAWLREPPRGLVWARPQARARIRRELAKLLADEPPRWDRFLAWNSRTRDNRLMHVTQGRLAADAGAQILHPLIDDGFLAALARAGGPNGFADRTATMESLFADALPPALLSRRDKAHFAGAVWTERTRAFAAQWDGTGVPADLVDVEALRAAWQLESPDGRSLALLHAALLASSRDGGEDLLDEPVL